MQLRVVTFRPRTTVGAVAAGTAIVIAGVGLLIVGTTLLIGVAAVGATAGVATLAYRRLTGRRSAGVDPLRADRTVGGAGQHERLGLDPRMEIQLPAIDGGSAQVPPPDARQP